MSCTDFADENLDELFLEASQLYYHYLECQTAMGMAAILQPVLIAKRICFFDNCISHRNYNRWHGFMG